MDEVENALISVLLPVGSLRPWLAECLESIKNSSNDLNVELIIVLNNVNDSDKEIVINLVKKIWGRDSQVLIDKSDNLAEVLNAGIKRANGQFIARIDDDDLMERDRLLNQIKHFNKYPKTVLIGGSTRVIDKNGQQIRVNHFPTNNNQIQQAIKYGNCFSHSTVMFSKKHAVSVGMYESKYLFAEDYQLWTKIAKTGEMYNLDIPVGSYRLHESQSNLKEKKTQVLTIKQIIQEIAITDFQEIHNPNRKKITRKNFKFKGNKGVLISVILSRQYFAIARLFADDEQRFNRRSIINLLISFIINPIEFSRLVLSVKSARSREGFKLDDFSGNIHKI
jgi:glycosyltransferase involved in cell wall biosynthesis